MNLFKIIKYLLYINRNIDTNVKLIKIKKNIYFLPDSIHKYVLLQKRIFNNIKDKDICITFRPFHMTPISNELSRKYRGI